MGEFITHRSWKDKTCCYSTIVTDMSDIMNNWTAVVPSSDCRVVLHCCSRSPGSDVGKKTAAGRPAPLPEKSNRKPTAERRACHPGTPPTWTRRRDDTRNMSGKGDILCEDKDTGRPTHTHLILYALLWCVHRVTLSTLNPLQRLLNLERRERDPLKNPVGV